MKTYETIRTCIAHYYTHTNGFMLLGKHIRDADKKFHIINHRDTLAEFPHGQTKLINPNDKPNKMWLLLSSEKQRSCTARNRIHSVE